MKSQRDEQMRVENLHWQAYERLAEQARWLGQGAIDDIKLALVSGQPEDIHFYAYFAGSKARDAITMARWAIEHRDQSHYATK